MNHQAEAAGDHGGPSSSAPSPTGHGRVAPPDEPVRTPGAPQSTVSGRRRALRWTGRILLVLALLTALWLAVCHAVLDNPRTDPPAASDAVIVLGPPDPVRMKRANALVEDHVADVLVIANPRPLRSNPPQLYEYYDESSYCEPREDVEVICFRPSPSTTQGEAITLRKLAEERGWDTVTAVTFTQHTPRARLILERCYPGDLRMSAVDYQLTGAHLLWQYVYQSAGYLKAWVTPGCEDQLPWKPKSVPGPTEG